MKSSNLYKILLKGLIIYACLIFLWGILHFVFHTTKFANSTDLPKFWDCVYFSSITFGTIGYGDIITNGFKGQVLVMVQSMTSIIYVGIFSGYMAYHFLKRPKNIFLSDFILFRPLEKDILFSLKVGNKGTELAECKLEICFTQINNDIKQTYYQKEIRYSLLEKSWHPTINLSLLENSEFLSALKKFYNNPDNTVIRILVTGTDLNSGEIIAFYKYYQKINTKISGKFLDIYNWNGLERTKPNWSFFNKTEDITNDNLKKVDLFLNSP